MDNKKERKASVLIPNLKVGIKDFLNNDGSVKDVRDVSIVQYKLDEEQIGLGVELTRLLLESRLLNDVVKMYLRSNYGSIRKFVEWYNGILKSNGEKLLSYGGVQSNIYLAEKRLGKIFEMDDPYMFILRYNIEKSKDSVVIKFNNLKSNVCRLLTMYASEESKVYSQMLISIDRDVFCSEMEEEAFDEFINTLKWYSKKVRDNVQALITKEEAGYFNYLLNSNTLNEEDLERKRMIEAIFLPIADIEEDDIEIED